MDIERISAYPSIYAVGHRAIQDIFSGTVVIEEKVDGSQWSMARVNGELLCRSKGQQVIVDAPNKMFEAAVATAKSLDLHDGWVYRCEYLKSPKHNTLAYSRIPLNHLMVFDVMTGPEVYLSPSEKAREASRIGIECVRCFYMGDQGKVDMAMFIAEDSVLGGTKIEGVVVKNYNMFTADKKIAIAKFVAPDFQEKHRHEWKQPHPTPTDFVQHLIGELKTDARWNKAVQHLRDNGVLVNAPQDIGALMKEVPADLEKEESDYIKEKLYTHFIGQIKRGVVSGLPEWYKIKLQSDLVS
jgi:ATP-dependent RNA circularization protein (DNA/RNA ligase family)